MLGYTLAGTGAKSSATGVDRVRKEGSKGRGCQSSTLGKSELESNLGSQPGLLFSDLFLTVTGLQQVPGKHGGHSCLRWCCKPLPIPPMGPSPRDFCPQEEGGMSERHCVCGMCICMLCVCACTRECVRVCEHVLYT